MGMVSPHGVHLACEPSELDPLLVHVARMAVCNVRVPLEEAVLDLPTELDEFIVQLAFVGLANPIEDVKVSRIQECEVEEVHQDAHSAFNLAELHHVILEATNPKDVVVDKSHGNHLILKHLCSAECALLKELPATW